MQVDCLQEPPRTFFKSLQAGEDPPSPSCPLPTPPPVTAAFPAALGMGEAPELFCSLWLGCTGVELIWEWEQWQHQGRRIVSPSLVCSLGAGMRRGSPFPIPTATFPVPTQPSTHTAWLRQTGTAQVFLPLLKLQGKEQQQVGKGEGKEGSREFHFL